MADAASRKKLKEIRSQNGNNICCECGKLNPQWISGTHFCTFGSRLSVIEKDEIESS